MLLLLSKAELLCQKQQVPPARGSPTCLPRATLHYRLCEVTAQVAAHWSDLEKELLVSAGTGVPMGILLDLQCSAAQGRKRCVVCDMLVPVAHQVIAQPWPCCSICPLLSKHVAFERSVTRLLGQAQWASSACRGKMFHTVQPFSLWSHGLHEKYLHHHQQPQESQASSTTSLEAPPELCCLVCEASLFTVPQLHLHATCKD